MRAGKVVNDRHYRQFRPDRQRRHCHHKAAEHGTWTLQLVLDEGAWEEVLTVTAEDADTLQDVLKNTKSVFYDIDRRVLMFGVTKAGD